LRVQVKRVPAHFSDRIQIACSHHMVEAALTHVVGINPNKRRSLDFFGRNGERRVMSRVQMPADNP
jgi:hypothetical protein